MQTGPFITSVWPWPCPTSHLWPSVHQSTPSLPSSHALADWRTEHTRHGVRQVTGIEESQVCPWCQTVPNSRTPPGNYSSLSGWKTNFPRVRKVGASQGRHAHKWGAFNLGAQRRRHLCSGPTCKLVRETHYVGSQPWMEAHEFNGQIMQHLLASDHRPLLRIITSSTPKFGEICRPQKCILTLLTLITLPFYHERLSASSNDRSPSGTTAVTWRQPAHMTAVTWRKAVFRGRAETGPGWGRLTCPEGCQVAKLTAFGAQRSMEHKPVLTLQGCNISRAWSGAETDKNISVKQHKYMSPAEKAVDGLLWKDW